MNDKSPKLQQGVALVEEKCLSLDFDLFAVGFLFYRKNIN